MIIHQIRYGSSIASSLMLAKVDLRLDIPGAMQVVSLPINSLSKGNVHDRLKLGHSLVHLLA